ncbi:dienelactone hydrolase [Bradyrhizobium sp. AZCC 1678]|uniref:dienelactone hydrolase family protein n=1 Tax=Bradyrhizobium sp. AZCC 1678 TaxID=3117030 RepID=UPI002FF2AD11
MHWPQIILRARFDSEYREKTFNNQTDWLYWTARYPILCYSKTFDKLTMEALMRVCLILTTFLATLMGFSAQAYAGKFVEFESGEAESKRVRLIGYLARPEGSGPFPAVVVLHGCGGFHQDMLAWADRLRRWGYVALAVDSFGPRDIETNCAAFADQPADAFRALAYLKTKPYVRADHVAVLGFSMGGISVLAALEQESISGLYPDKFSAGVALYPKCSSSTGLMTAPTLVLIGALDDWTPASDCEAMAAGRSELGISRSPGDRSLVQLIIYPDAHHGFDLAGLRFTKGIKSSGHHLEYNDAATRDSIEKVRAFFRQTLSNE